MKLIVKDTAEIQEATILVTRKPYDLKIEKYISNIFVNGQVVQSGNYQNEGIKKIEINKKQVKSANVIIEYTFRVTNIGQIDGYIGKITDMLPQGLEFVAGDNEGYWNISGNIATTSQFENTEIKSGQYKEIKIKARWNNSELSTLQNKVTLESGGNKYEFEDIGLANNKDEASLIVSISTGAETVIFYVIVVSVIIGMFIAEARITKKKNN